MYIYHLNTTTKYTRYHGFHLFKIPKNTVLTLKGNCCNVHISSEHYNNWKFVFQDSKSTEFHSNGIPPDPYGTKPTGFFSLPSVFNLDQDHAPPEENEEKQTISRGCCVKFRLNNALKVDIISRILFPTTFVGFNAFYWFYYYTKSTTEVN